MPNPNTAQHQDQFSVANGQTRVEVSSADLPLACPNEYSQLWASHPRVFLPIEDSAKGEVLCPYCGTHYVLKP